MTLNVGNMVAGFQASCRSECFTDCRWSTGISHHITTISRGIEIYRQKKKPLMMSGVKGQSGRRPRQGNRSSLVREAETSTCTQTQPPPHPPKISRWVRGDPDKCKVLIRPNQNRAHHLWVEMRLESEVIFGAPLGNRRKKKKKNPFVPEKRLVASARNNSCVPPHTMTPSLSNLDNIAGACWCGSALGDPSTTWPISLMMEIDYSRA